MVFELNSVVMGFEWVYLIEYLGNRVYFCMRESVIYSLGLGFVRKEISNEFMGVGVSDWEIVSVSGV